MTNQADTLNIVGCGRAAGSLARLWLQTGLLRIGGVMNRSVSSTRAAIHSLGQGSVAADFDDFSPASFWLIGTNDDQIEQVAAMLSETSLDLTNSVVFHLCGRHSVDILDVLKNRGCLVAAVHPVRSLTHADITIEDFTGTACVAEGGEEVLQRLEPLFSTIGGQWMPVSNVDRGLYHASVSIISNITKAVAWKAQHWLTHAGLTDEMAVSVTQNLLHSTLEDMARSGARQSITGPVVRGDTRTIEAHIQALQESYPDDVDVYKVLAQTVLELARERGDLDDPTLERFMVLLRRENQPV